MSFIEAGRALPHFEVADIREPTVPLQHTGFVHSYNDTMVEFRGAEGAFLLNLYELQAIGVTIFGLSAGQEIHVPTSFLNQNA